MSFSIFNFLFLTTVFFLVNKCCSDTPANCTYEDIKGLWTFSVSTKFGKKSIDCSKFSEKHNEYIKTTVNLLYPNTVVDEFGNSGFWTLIYNQGFEVVVHGRKYFAFSNFVKKNDKVYSICNETLQHQGWSHDLLGNNWACFSGTKSQSSKIKVHETKLDVSYRKRRYSPNSEFIRKINSVQSSWKAENYAEYEDLSLEDLLQRSGGKLSNGRPFVSTAKVNEETARAASYLPEQFDWRDVNGFNYVSPVRNQQQCGSCYAFASAAMIEARLRIVSNNTKQTIFSPQDIMDCTLYAQGCNGGFPYLIAGKYAEDFGLVSESCNPYRGSDSKYCDTKAECSRHYATNYKYVGGYYGGCNEQLMKLAIVNNGPIAVSFQVYADFKNYKSGIYIHSKQLDGFNPWKVTNHVVLIVGYGIDYTSNIKYWIVKNSWGKNWGEHGYFRIIRGVDECSIESIAVESTPIL